MKRHPKMWLVVEDEWDHNVALKQARSRGHYERLTAFDEQKLPDSIIDGMKGTLQLLHYVYPSERLLGPTLVVVAGQPTHGSHHLSGSPSAHSHRPIFWEIG